MTGNVMPGHLENHRSLLNYMIWECFCDFSVFLKPFDLIQNTRYCEYQKSIPQKLSLRGTLVFMFPIFIDFLSFENFKFFSIQTGSLSI